MRLLTLNEGTGTVKVRGGEVDLGFYVDAPIGAEPLTAAFRYSDVAPARLPKIA